MGGIWGKTFEDSDVVVYDSESGKVNSDPYTDEKSSGWLSPIAIVLYSTAVLLGYVGYRFLKNKKVSNAGKSK